MEIVASHKPPGVLTRRIGKIVERDTVITAFSWARAADPPQPENISPAARTKIDTGKILRERLPVIL
jgi:hypothetical protein